MIINPYRFAPASPTLEFIIWLGKTNVTESANSTLTKTGGSSGQWDAGAYSQQEAASGKIYCEHRCISGNELGIFGISNATDAAANVNFTNIDYSLFAYVGGLYRVENGVVTNTGITYTNNDIVSVEVNASNQIVYRKNGVVIYTVTSPTLNYPLRVDCSIEIPNTGILANCKVKIG